MATFITSEKNKRKLCDEENYIYEKNGVNNSKTKIYWRCERFYDGCKARLHTTFNYSIPEVIHSNGSHNHPANSAHVNARKAVNSMKSDVMIMFTVSLREVISTTLQNLDEEAQSFLPTLPGLSRNIRNWRQQTLGIPALPVCRSGFEIPHEFKYLENGSLFLIFDSGIEDPDRILVFFPPKMV